MKIVMLLLAVFVLSCNNAKKEQNTSPKDTSYQSTDATSGATTANNMAGCYMAVQNRDTILLQLQIKDSLVTGTMQYDNFGIDGNIGTVQATLRGNRIEGYFRFASEGMWSVRQVIWEQRNGYLVQADTKNMNFTSDTATFDKNNIMFDEERPFKPADCNLVQFGPLPR